MNAIPKKPESAAFPTSEEPLGKAWDSATNLRDAISGLRLLVAKDWGSMIEADTARNAIVWMSMKMDEDCDALHSAIEDLKPWEARS